MSRSKQLSIVASACILLFPLAPSSAAAPCDSSTQAFVSTKTVQVIGSKVVHPQDVYLAPSLDLFLVSFLPNALDLDALHVLSEDSLLFSANVNYTVATPGGNVNLLHNRPYLLDYSGGSVVIQADAGWTALGVTLPSMNGLYRYGSGPLAGCYAATVAVAGTATQGAWVRFVRPWEVWRFCPAATPELFFDAGALLGATGDIDALHIDGDRVVFSVNVDRPLSGGPTLRHANAYTCLPTGVGRTCAANTVSLAFDGVASGLTSLGAFTPVGEICPCNSLAWARRFGGTGSDEAFAVAVDAAGFTYATGSFSGSANFDPGQGTPSLASAGSRDGFVQKVNRWGFPVWTRRFGGTGFDAGFGVAADSAGNVYVTGRFEGTAEFAPGSGASSLVSAGNADVFVAKYDANGNVLWVRALGGGGFDAGLGIAVDGSGNVYTTGTFRDTADFDPGAGVTPLTSAGGSDVFVLKLSAAGALIWARGFGGAEFDMGSDVAVDAAGNVHTAGTFRDTADFDPNAGVTPLVSAGSADAFVSKLNSSGNLVWARRFGGGGFDASSRLALDVAGSVHVQGTFSATADFDVATDLVSSGGFDAFVVKLDSAGILLWANPFGGAGDDVGEGGVALDAAGNVYATGSFSGTPSLPSAGGRDVFLLVFDSAGAPVQARAFGGAGFDQGYRVAVDASGYVYPAGAFEGMADFDPGPGARSLSSAGLLDGFGSKLCPLVP